MVSRVSTEKRVARIDAALLKKQPSLQVMLDSVHNSQNLSTIIRTCDAVGVLDVYYSTPQNEMLRIHKTITQGAHRWTRRHRVNELDKVAFLKEKKAQGFQVVVTHLNAQAVNFRSIDYTQPTLIVMGNEKEGVSQALIDESTHCVVIPMQGMVQSLNVSVATALILYEAQRQLENVSAYEKPQLSRTQREEIKASWIYRDTVARRSKGGIALEFQEEVLHF